MNESKQIVIDYAKKFGYEEAHSILYLARACEWNSDDMLLYGMNNGLLNKPHDNSPYSSQEVFFAKEISKKIGRRMSSDEILDFERLVSSYGN